MELNFASQNMELTFIQDLLDKLNSWVEAPDCLKSVGNILGTTEGWKPGALAQR